MPNLTHCEITCTCHIAHAMLTAHALILQFPADMLALSQWLFCSVKHHKSNLLIT